MKKIYLSISLLISGMVSLAQTISLEHLSAYKTNVFDEGAAEIVSYDHASQRLFFTNANANSIGILDFSNPDSLELIDEISLDAYGDGVNSVSVYNGFVAVAVEIDGAPGKVVFFNAQGAFQSQVTVGNLPDMVTFTHDGNKVVVACEGEPESDFITDEPGQVAIIDVSGGIASITQANVTMIGFENTMLSLDVRIFGNEGITTYEEDFQDTALGLNEFVSYSQFSNRNWFHDSFNDDYFAEINGFNGDTSSLDWLVSPLINLGTFSEAYFSFYSAKNFNGGSLNLLISSDYDGLGDPTSANWDTITNQAVWSPGGYLDTNSGAIDISAYVGSDVAIAFFYKAEPNSATLWQIDDFKFWGNQSIEATIEPEYVTISEDDATAFITLQENNAVAIIDLTTNTLTAVKALGYKDHSVAGYGLDASDKDDTINITTYPIRGLYLPDAITSYTVNGATYLVTANEGDARDYDAFSEEERIKNLDLDPIAFPNAATLQADENAGRLNITTTLGDTDGDGDYDELYSFGARSFTIWDANGNLVWDSGDQFEQQTAIALPDYFNSGNDDNDDFEGRSDNKGPEPEAAEVANINGEWYAFIGLERIGGVMVYNVNNPTSPQFVQYINNRNFSVDADTPEAGDLGVEDVLFISGSQSPDGNTYIFTSNEISGSVSVFKVNGVVGVSEINKTSFNAFPNPTNSFLNLSEKAMYSVHDISGRVVVSPVFTNTIDVSNLTPGVYFISNAEGNTNTFVKH